MPFSSTTTHGRSAEPRFPDAAISISYFAIVSSFLWFRRVRFALAVYITIHAARRINQKCSHHRQNHQHNPLLSKDFTGILTRKDNTGKVMEDYSKDATPLPASEENGVVWVDADVSGWGGVRIAVPEGTPTDSVSACYLEEGALLIVDAGGSDCLLEGRVSDLRQNGIRQLCLRWNGGEQTLSTDALAAAGGEDASFRLTEVNGGLTMVLNGLTRNELLAK